MPEQKCPTDCKSLIYDTKNNPICTKFKNIYLHWVWSFTDTSNNGLFKCDACIKERPQK